MSAIAPFADPAVEAVFDGHPPALRTRLLELRRLILETARTAPGVGEIVETLKWGEPAYLPKRPKVGTTVRIDAVKGSKDRVAAYFHCRTTLVDSFRQLYPESFAFEGNRALLLDATRPLPEEELKHCFALALTYHLASRSARRQK